MTPGHDWKKLNSRHHCPTHRQVGFAMASELGSSLPQADLAGRKLDAIALDLADARLPGNPEAELIETGRVLDEWLTAENDEVVRADFDDLLLTNVIAEGRGRESAVVAAALAACDHAGLNFGVVASDKHLYLAHMDLEEPYVLAPRFGWRFVEATDLHEGTMKWLCPHELAMQSLDAIYTRAHTLNLVNVQLKVSELRVDMPMDRHTQESHETELKMAQARFN
jgi:hypothetical protein